MNKKTLLACDSDKEIYEINNLGAQGDIRIMRVKKIPEHYEETNNFIVAHSETNHHHVVREQDVNIYAKSGNERKKYIKLKGNYADVIHLKDHAKHKTLRINGNPGDVFKIVRSVDFWKGIQRIRAD